MERYQIQPYSRSAIAPVNPWISLARLAIEEPETLAEVAVGLLAVAGLAAILKALFSPR